MRDDAKQQCCDSDDEVGDIVLHQYWTDVFITAARRQLCNLYRFYIFPAAVPELSCLSGFSGNFSVIILENLKPFIFKNKTSTSVVWDSSFLKILKNSGLFILTVNCNSEMFHLNKDPTES